MFPVPNSSFSDIEDLEQNFTSNMQYETFDLTSDDLNDRENHQTITPQMNLTNSYFSPISTSPQVSSYLSPPVISPRISYRTPYSYMNNLFTPRRMPSSTSTSSLLNPYPAYQQINASLANLPHVEVVASQFLREARSKIKTFNTNQHDKRKMTGAEQPAAGRSVRKRTNETQISELDQNILDKPHSNDENEQQNETSTLEVDEITELLREQRELKEKIDRLQMQLRSNEMMLCQKTPCQSFDRDQTPDL